MIGIKKVEKELHHTEREFIRIVEELKKQEEIDIKQDGQIISALRAHAEGNQQLNKQMGRLIRSTTVLATTQIVLVLMSIVVGAYVAVRF
jgi:CTP-dependent riboflavin kinase